MDTNGLINLMLLDLLIKEDNRIRHERLKNINADYDTDTDADYDTDDYDDLGFFPRLW